MARTEPPARARRPRPGDPSRIGAYEVIGFLGEGGMGSVFAGRDRDGGLVAIKVIRPELAGDPQFRARFRREAASAMRVPRFCTAEVLAADPEADAPYLVTEYIDAPTLKESVRASGPLRGGELDQLAVAMAAALVGIHATGIVHRDLKPGNVLLSRMGPRVIDFGVAKPLDATRLTAGDQVLGTPAYMAPEQLRGHPGPASDVFAWGGAMIFAASGRRPFAGESVPEMASAILHGEPDLGCLTGRLRNAVAAALTKDPDTRPSPAALMEMLGVAPSDLLTSSTSSTAGEAPVTDRTRTDLTTGSFTAGGPSDFGLPDSGPSGSGPSIPPPGPPPDGAAPLATRSDDTSVPADWQPVYTPPPPSKRRRRFPLALAATLVALVTVVAALYLRGRSSLEVTGVSVRAAKARHGCDANVDLIGTVTTNGASGEIDYRWKRSDQKTPGPPLHETVHSGSKLTTVHLLWRISGQGKRKFSATLMVLNDPEPQKSVSFTYSCKE